MNTRALDVAVHSEVLVRWIESGRAPPCALIADSLHESRAVIEAALVRLHAVHGLVLHPSEPEVWVAHPFSSTPTAFWVRGASGGWWAPCIWCALGVATLVHEPVTIHTRSGGEDEPLAIRVDDGRVSPHGLVAHFPIPLARAWDNVHRFCASTLVFQNERDVDAWSVRHGFERGAMVELERLERFARDWYGGHLSCDWRKVTLAEARALLAKHGFAGSTWELPESDEGY